MPTLSSERALERALRLCSRGYIDYAVQHSNPVRRAGDEEVRDFFVRADEEDAGLEDALFALLSERGHHPGSVQHELRYGSYNFLDYARLLDYAATKELPAELAGIRSLNQALGAESATASDAAASSLLQWIAQTREDQLKRATALRDKRR